MRTGGGGNKQVLPENDLGRGGGTSRCCLRTIGGVRKDVGFA